MAVPDYTFKLIIVGDASAGKTSLTHRYLSGIFVDSPRLTIGVDFFSKKIKLEDGKRVKLQIWTLVVKKGIDFYYPRTVKALIGH
jgi:GTPase SAR1 family protein